MTTNRTRRTRYAVTYTSLSGATLTDVVLATDAAEAAAGAVELLAVDTIISVTAARARKAAKVDGFDAWAAATGEPSTTHVNGFEVIDNQHGTRDGRPMFETIAEFAFAIEVAAAADGQLFA